jgi:hypothetical protein
MAPIYDMHLNVSRVEPRQEGAGHRVLSLASGLVVALPKAQREEEQDRRPYSYLTHGGAGLPSWLVLEGCALEEEEEEEEVVVVEEVETAMTVQDFTAWAASLRCEYPNRLKLRLKESR